MASLQPSDDYRPSDEDYNQPSAERRVVLQRLQDIFGDVPVHFWALAHVCDVKTLEEFAEQAEANSGPYHMTISQTRAMISTCKLNSLRFIYALANVLQGLNH
jgi:hypothetical protein